MQLDELVKVASYLMPGELEQLRNAYFYADQAHQTQKRKDGSPYVSHPTAVAGILANLKMDVDTLIAALLHDVIEDTSINREQITKQFGIKVTNIVDGVTKLPELENNQNKTATKQQRNARTFRKMLLFSITDVRVLFVKIADRLHNMSTLIHMSDAKRKQIANETLCVYAPLAHHAGLSKTAEKLEYLSLCHLYEKRAESLQKAIHKRHLVWEERISQCIQEIQNELSKHKIHATIQSREKSLYSFYRKRAHRKVRFKNIQDLHGLRIITDHVSDCYRILGLIHSLFEHKAGLIKDYIALPKKSGYQSLHTTLETTEQGMSQPLLLEVQIRTKEMNQVAEYGIAAHYAYKRQQDQKSNTDLQEDHQFSQWIKTLLNQLETENEVEISQPN